MVLATAAAAACLAVACWALGAAWKHCTTSVIGPRRLLWRLAINGELDTWGTPKPWDCRTCLMCGFLGSRWRRLHAAAAHIADTRVNDVEDPRSRWKLFDARPWLTLRRAILLHRADTEDRVEICIALLPVMPAAANAAALHAGELARRCRDSGLDFGGLCCRPSVASHARRLPGRHSVLIDSCRRDVGLVFLSPAAIPACIKQALLMRDRAVCIVGWPIRLACEMLTCAWGAWAVLAPSPFR
jgi:hypothetical protein